MQFLDFEKETQCNSPYTMEEGLGCIWLYHRNDQIFQTGFDVCQSRDQYGTVFEMHDFDTQHSKLYDFLQRKGGKMSSN